MSQLLKIVVAAAKASRAFSGESPPASAWVARSHVLRSAVLAEGPNCESRVSRNAIAATSAESTRCSMSRNLASRGTDGLRVTRIPKQRQKTTLSTRRPVRCTGDPSGSASDCASALEVSTSRAFSGMVTQSHSASAAARYSFAFIARSRQESRTARSMVKRPHAAVTLLRCKIRARSLVCVVFCKECFYARFGVRENERARARLGALSNADGGYATVRLAYDEPGQPLCALHPGQVVFSNSIISLKFSNLAFAGTAWSTAGIHPPRPYSFSALRRTSRSTSLSS